MSQILLKKIKVQEQESLQYYTYGTIVVNSAL